MVVLVALVMLLLLLVTMARYVRPILSPDNDSHGDAPVTIAVAAAAAAAAAIAPRRQRFMSRACVFYCRGLFSTYPRKVGFKRQTRWTFDALEVSKIGAVLATPTMRDHHS